MLSMPVYASLYNRNLRIGCKLRRVKLSFLKLRFKKIGKDDSRNFQAAFGIYRIIETTGKDKRSIRNGVVPEPFQSQYRRYFSSIVIKFTNIR